MFLFLYFYADSAVLSLVRSKLLPPVIVDCGPTGVRTPYVGVKIWSFSKHTGDTEVLTTVQSQWHGISACEHLLTQHRNKNKQKKVDKTEEARLKVCYWGVLSWPLNKILFFFYDRVCLLGALLTLSSKKCKEIIQTWQDLSLQWNRVLTKTLNLYMSFSAVTPNHWAVV